MRISLAEDLQHKKTYLSEFKDIAIRILSHLDNVITGKSEYNDYLLLVSDYAGIRKNLRPINSKLFIFDVDKFKDDYHNFSEILQKLSLRNFNFDKQDYHIIDKVTYTLQQSIGIGLDLFVESNSAKKHVGNRFEELIKTIIDEINISNKKIVLKIPYTPKNFYRCETDLVISPDKIIKSSSENIAADEIVISLKTTSKDRMGKIFIDKILMSRFVKHDVKVVGIFLNDVQRKKDDKISYTLVSNLFMVYTKFLTKLDGVYFIDLPKNAKISAFQNYIFPFSKFILEDIWKLLNLEV